MSNHTKACIQWYELMVRKVRELPTEEVEALNQWERENLGDGHSATSDWPGWRKHLPPPPWWPLSKPWLETWPAQQKKVQR